MRCVASFTTTYPLQETTHGINAGMVRGALRTSRIAQALLTAFGTAECMDDRDASTLLIADLVPPFPPNMTSGLVIWWTLDVCLLTQRKYFGIHGTPYVTSACGVRKSTAWI